MLRKLIESTYQSSKYIFETNNISNIPETLLTRFFSLKYQNPKRRNRKCFKKFNKKK